MFNIFNKNKRIQKAIYDENPKLLERLLKSGGDPNVQNNSKETPIFQVVHSFYGKQFEMLRFLIRYGADLNIRNSDGVSVIHLVRSSKIAKILVDSGADVNIKDKRGNSVLHYPYSVKLANFYISKGVDVNIKNKAGYTPLHTNDSSLELTKILLENGAEAEVQDEYGTTPLMGAAGSEDFIVEDEFIESKNICIELLKAGAKIDTRDSDGKNAYDYALKVKNIKLAEFLKQYKN